MTLIPIYQLYLQNLYISEDPKTRLCNSNNVITQKFKWDGEMGGGDEEIYIQQTLSIFT